MVASTLNLKQEFSDKIKTISIPFDIYHKILNALTNDDIPSGFPKVSAHKV